MVRYNLYKWGVYKWGNLERFYSFPYKLTSINGEMGNGGLNVSETTLPTQNNFYTWGFYAYVFPSKMQILRIFVLLHEDLLVV